MQSREVQFDSSVTRP
nr:unnamed protein product [Callosobruchus chinensis]CAH7732369.1 unnamed protein product [Callosobruchus chinensis]CAH7753160.1 unnamed protein product [Callosobruchus chinensis]